MLLASYLLPVTCLAVAAQGLSIERHDNRGQRDGPIINIGYAKYQGVRLEAGVDEFLGMRYAKAPLGSLRFRAPQDPVPHRSIQDASKFGPICVGTGEAVDLGHAEDCLFVNVFKPSAATKSSKLPVWVYIQGGGYALNSNANYNGTHVVQQSGNNIVFVNFNYRVGALGFLASEKVRQNGDLNAGLLDQRKLLNWVHENIAKFGGDPNHVVIHGASAGAGSVAYHLTIGEGKKDNRLFVGAIAESPYTPTQRTVAEMEFQFQRLLQKANCSSLDCLRAVDIETFMAISPNSPFPDAASSIPLPQEYWLPVIDGTLISDHIYTLLDQGSFAPVPVLVGDDTNEGSYFAYNATEAADLMMFMKNNYPHLDSAQLRTISQLYPLMEPAQKHAAYYPSASAAFGDAAFTCPGNEIAFAVAQHFDSQRVWNYRYNVLDPDNIAAGLGVPHLFETSAIFGAGFADPTAASYLTTNAGIIPITMQYFISFIRELNPNSFKDPSAPNWDPWGEDNGQRMRLQTNNTAMEVLPQELIDKCALWKILAHTTEV